MTPDSLKRLLVTLLGMAILALGSRFGLDAPHALGLAGLLSAFLLQSGGNALADKLAKSKGLGSLMGELAKAQGLYQQLRAAQAQSAAQSAPPNPGASNS